ncbi:MAG: YihY/virulence factor BrkB family protein [Pirellulales bacterium]
MPTTNAGKDGSTGGRIPSAAVQSASGNFWLDVAKQWWKDDCLHWGAALAFHSVLAMAPLLFTLVFVAGLFLDKGETRDQIAAAIARDFGGEVSDVAKVVMDSMEGAPKSSWSAWLALSVAAISASALFGQLRRTLNHVWNVDRAASSWRDTLVGRLLAIAMVALVGLVIIVSFILSALTTAVIRLAGDAVPQAGSFLTVLDFAPSFVVVALAVACVFKWLPDVDIRWRVALVGGVATAVLFTVGKLCVGYYIRTAEVGSAYGAAGSIVVALVWIYYTAQAFFLGAEFTEVWASRRGYTIDRNTNEQREAPGGA